MVFQRSQWHILINQKSLLSISTISNKIYQIRMVEEAEHQNFNKKLLIPLQSITIKLLHSNNLSKKLNQMVIFYFLRKKYITHSTGYSSNVVRIPGRFCQFSPCKHVQILLPRADIPDGNSLSQLLALGK